MKTSLKASSYIVLVIATLAHATVAHAQGSDKPAAASADAYLERGLAHYDARAFEKAIKAFLAGYKIDPRPVFLFALGQAERRSGDCRSALSYYRRFLATSPPAAQERAARMHIRGCKKALVSGPALDPERAGSDTGPGQREPKRPDPAAPAKTRTAIAATPAAPSLPEPDASPPVQSSPWYHDATGGVLLGTGTIALLAGVGFLATSESIHDQAAWAPTYPEYDIEITRARRYRLWGIAAITTGTALAAGALYRYHRYSRRESPSQRNIGISPTSGGLAISYGGQF